MCVDAYMNNSVYQCTCMYVHMQMYAFLSLSMHIHIHIHIQKPRTTHMKLTIDMKGNIIRGQQ